MTPDERFERIEKQLEAVAGQQGQFYTDLRQLTEQIGNQEKQISQVVAIVRGIGDMLGDVLRAQERTENHLLETDQRLRETDQRLNVLINVVERRVAGTDRRSGSDRRQPSE